LACWLRHVGDEYLKITQSAATNEEFLKNELIGVIPEGEKLIANKTWLVFDGSDSRALVNVTSEATTVVSGTIPMLELEAAVNALVTSPSSE